MASPRTSVAPPETQVREPREGLSVQTLTIAAMASGLAAITVSQFWEQGTIFASAMTPVVVAIVSELLRKPVESERVRGSVRAASSIARPRSGRTPTVMAPPTPGVDEGLQQREQGVEAGPVRVYSSGSNRRPSGITSSPRRRLHPKIAVITGLIGFLIAAAALTLPELIFGGSVSGGHRDTTYFGGAGSSKGKDESKDGTSDGSADSPTQRQGNDSTAPGDGQDRPAQPPSGDQPAPDTQETAPPPSDSTTPVAPTPPAPSPPAP